jgi:putative CocE/NonD family hydrolase
MAGRARGATTLEGHGTGHDLRVSSAVDYDDLVLRWMDHHLRGIDNGVDRESPVRIFVMGDDEWRDESAWPPPSAKPVSYYLGAAASPDASGVLSKNPPKRVSDPSSFVSDPANPVRDPHETFGPHDYAELEEATGLLVFESAPLAEDTEITGAIEAEIYLSCDCRDTDLWAKVLDVGPSGAAFNLMSPGLDVLRASLREPIRGRQLLEPGKVYRLRLEGLVTSNVFKKGHRLRILVSSSFFPHFSRNLHTGESEVISASMKVAEIRIHHDPEHPSRLVVPVVPR